MSAIRRAVGISIEIAAVVVIVALVASQVLGQPVLLGFVETGSMAPTLDPGDGFVAIPSAVSGDVEEGDVVVFQAEEIQGGGLTTHRVVDETERGYITRGDANPFTDQDGSEPPVKKAQIVATALQVGGTVVVIPELGTVVTALRDGLGGVQRQLAVTLGTRSLLGTQGIAYLVMALAAVGYVADLIFSSDGRRPDSPVRARDSGTSTWLILVALAGVVVVAATAAMWVPAGNQEFGIISAEFDSEDPTTIPQGESTSIRYTVPNAGLVPVHAYVEPASRGVATDPQHVYVSAQGQATTRVTLSAPAETGYYRRYVVTHRYLALLPVSVIDVLYDTHPWLPVVVIDLLLGGSVYLIGRAFVGTGRVRLRRATRARPGLLDRLL